MEKKQRLNWLDIARGLAILSIVVGHIEYNSFFYKKILAYIGEFHVSIFFVITGYTLTEEKLCQFATFIKNKLKTLYLPLVIFYLISVVLHNLFIDIGVYSTDIAYSGKHMTYYSYGRLIQEIILTFFMLTREPIVGAMWFVCTLIISLFCYCVITNIIKNIENYKYIRLIIITVFLVISEYLTYMGYTIPRLSNVPAAMICINLGQIVREKGFTFRNKYLMTFFSILVFSVGVLHNVGVGFNGNNLEHPVFFIPITICGIYITFYISKFIELKCGGGYDM